MSYIIAVNPVVLVAAGPNIHAGATGTRFTEPAWRSCPRMIHSSGETSGEVNDGGVAATGVRRHGRTPVR
jgi:hypothetical protein